MTVFLSHTTALELWRVFGAQAPRLGSSRAQLSLGNVPQSSGDELAAHVMKAFPQVIRSASWRADGIDVMVAHARDRRRSDGINAHVWSAELPPRSFAKLASDVHLSSPELVFLQMATRLSLIELVQLGYELCGTYAIDKTAERGFSARPAPLTSSAKLSAYLERTSRAKGLEAARRAAKLVANGSASPMETALSMVLCLPLRHGGCALPPAKMNEELVLSLDAAPGQKRTRRCRCDLFWPEFKVAIEYESDAEHLSSQKFSEDSIRRNDLVASNITVITVTKRELLNLACWPSMAARVGKLVGKRRRIRLDDYAQRQRMLYAQLFGAFFDFQI